MTAFFQCLLLREYLEPCRDAYSRLNRRGRCLVNVVPVAQRLDANTRLYMVHASFLDRVISRLPGGPGIFSATQPAAFRLRRKLPLAQ